MRINGSCVPKDSLCDSKKGEVYNDTTGNCDCMKGYEIKNNSCVP